MAEGVLTKPASSALKAAGALDVAAAQIQGARDRQEDTFAVEPLGGALLLILSDGMGGHPCGNDASRIAVQAVRGHVRASFVSRATLADCGPLLRAAFAAAQHAVLDFAGGCPECKNMGATLIAAIVSPTTLVFTSCGDSPFYRLDRAGRLHALNERHLDARGKLTNWIGYRLPADDGSDVVHRLDDTAALLLASDGLDTLSSKQVMEILRLRGSAALATRRLLDAVTAANLEEQDNATVILVRVPPASAPL